MLLIETISMRYRYPAHGHAFAVAACRLRAKPSEVRVVSFSPDPAGTGFPGESLLLIAAAGRIGAGTLADPPGTTSRPEVSSGGSLPSATAG